jgi:hypothetical protein
MGCLADNTAGEAEGPPICDTCTQDLYRSDPKLVRHFNLVEAANCGGLNNKKILIPILIDQNPCAHWRKPMAMMRQGCSTSLFHASQQ